MDVIDRMNVLPSDAELLRRYADTGAADDLAALVRRYVDLVYSAARRQLRDEHAAQDVTQQVFIVLLRKGRRLRPDTVLASWLLKVTALECRNVIKADARRARRERKVALMTSEVRAQSVSGELAAPAWDDLAPHLDAALEALSAGDREAVVLRYFLDRSYPEAAAALGASEGSVRQRVHRGLAKMRSVLGSRGVVATEAALTAALLAHAVEQAPASVGTATVAAIGSAAVAETTLVNGVFTLMSATSTVKFSIAAALLLLAIGLTTFLLAGRHDGNRVNASAAPSATAPTEPPPGIPQVIDGGEPVVTAAAPPPPAAPALPAPPRKVFDVITAKTCDARQGPKDGFDHLGFINRGDWVEYDNVEFPPADAPRAMAFCAVVSCPEIYAGNDIEVHIGAPDGPTIATLTVEATAGYGDFVCQEAPIQTAPTGTQDVFLVFSGGGFNLRSIKFTIIDGRPADQRTVATGYSMAKKVNEGNQALVNVRNGAWARYDCLQFPAEGADTFTLSYAVDAGHAGGTISVRLDHPNAPAICEIPIVSTWSYGRYYQRTVALAKTITGNHDVYLTFTGQDRGYMGLADVTWFSFNKVGTAKVNGPPAPPPPPATRPATRPTTQPANAENRGVTTLPAAGNPKLLWGL